MKALLMFMLLGSSMASFAHTCQISLYDPMNRPYLNFNSQNDQDCENAANSCYQTISRMRLNPNLYKCYTVVMEADPRRPSPTPTVKPAPVETPVKTDSDAQRGISQGETVLFGNQIWVVTEVSKQGFLDLIPDEKRKESKIVTNISRQSVAIMRGCHQNFCTRDSVIDLRNNQQTSILAITSAGEFITQVNADSQMVVNVPASVLAKAKGCSAGLCVGAIVQDRAGNYYRVAAVQGDGNLVIETDDSRKLIVKNMPPSQLTQVR